MERTNGTTGGVFGGLQNPRRSQRAGSGAHLSGLGQPRERLDRDAANPKGSSQRGNLRPPTRGDAGALPPNGLGMVATKRLSQFGRAAQCVDYVRMLHDGGA